MKRVENKLKLKLTFYKRNRTKIQYLMFLKQQQLHLQMERVHKYR